MESDPANPSLAAVLSALKLAYQPAQRSMLHGAGARTGAKALSVRMEDSDETMTEEEYLKVLEAEKQAEMAKMMEEDPEMAEKIARIERGMKGKTGAVLAPWMKVDAKAIVEAEREREQRAVQWEMNKNVVDESEVTSEGLGIRQIKGTREVEMTWPRKPSYITDYMGFLVEKKSFETDGKWSQIAGYNRVKSLRTDYPGDFAFIEEQTTVGEAEYRVLGFKYDGAKKALFQQRIEVENVELGVGGIAAIAIFLIIVIAFFVVTAQDVRIYN
jgi:hypothetical protein